MASAEIMDWTAVSSEVFCNPRMPEEDKRRITRLLLSLDDFEGHIWLATSGSSGHSKWVALSKEAFLISAAAVNKHLQSQHTDIWLQALPSFHAGGLGILARGFLSGSPVVAYQEDKWEASRFVKQLKEAKATLTTLVPAQVFDLVTAQLAAPASVRAVVVGGGALSEVVYAQARLLGWKLLPSYGLTECGSQVATAPLEAWTKPGFPSLVPLSHVSLALDAAGYLKIKSAALLSAYAYVEGDLCRTVDPKVAGWLTTEDQPLFEEGKIRKITRGNAFIKIGGESVDLGQLDKLLEELRLALLIKADMALVAMPDERLGHMIHLAVAGEVDIARLLKEWEQRVLPFERIRQVHLVDSIPRSPLQKVLPHVLMKTLSSN